MRKLIGICLLVFTAFDVVAQSNPIYNGPLDSRVSFPIVYNGLAKRVTGQQLRDSLVGGGHNFANTDLSFIGDRAHDLNGYSLQLYDGVLIALSAGGNAIQIDSSSVNVIANGYTAALSGEDLHQSRTQKFPDRDGSFQVNSNDEPTMVLDGSDSVIATLIPGSTDDYGEVELQNIGSTTNFKKVVLIFNQPYASIAVPVISSSLQGGVYYLFSAESDTNGFAFAVPAVPIGSTIKIYYQVKGK